MINLSDTVVLENHKPAFKGATFRVVRNENGVQIKRTDLEDEPVVSSFDENTDNNFREARTQAQVMAKRESNSEKEALVRIPSTNEFLGFGGSFEEEKRTPTPQEDLENLEDHSFSDDKVSECISKEVESGRPQKQAVAICLSKRDRGELSDSKFFDESASKPNPDIEVNDDVEQTLERLVEEHNEEVDRESRKATIGQLKSVYSRGRGAFTQTSRPGVDSATQWALARVKNAYLPLLKTAEPPNEDYVQDNDLLPKAHPKSTRGMKDTQTGLEKERLSDVETERLVELTKAEEVYSQYQQDTKLTVEQLEKWINDPCRERASGNDHDKHIKRAIFLLSEIDSPQEAVSTKVPDEIAMDRAERRVPDKLEGEAPYNLAVFQMEYASSFISRHRAMIEDPENISTITEDCPSISESALRNWGGSHFENPQI